MLNFYTDISLITAENRKRIFPLLLDVFYLKNHALEHFKAVESIEDAAICIFPIDISYPKNKSEEKKLQLFISTAKKVNKKVWVYAGGDFGKSIQDSHVIVFRLSGFDSKLDQNTCIMPSFVNDVYTSNFTTEWVPITKPELPTIGFVGNADGSVTKWLKEFLIFGKQTLKKIVGKDQTDLQSFFPSSSIRYSLLKQLGKDLRIKTNFIYRKKYRAGAKTDEEKRKTTLEFLENINNNLYTFCLRGSGNFSVRFYETLMMGRIPLLIDTDVRLPLENKINWKHHCVKASKQNYIEQLITFHKNHTNEELIQIQANNRTLAKQLLERIAYFVEVSKDKNSQ